MSPTEIKTFIRAGRAVFTLQSGRTGTHFTYRITQGAPRDATAARGAPFFCSVLIAPEVWAYIGVLAGGGVKLTKASKVSGEAPSFVALQWFLRHLERGCLPDALIFRHEGRCGRCGRELTTPASIDTGLGPDCAAALGMPHEDRRGPAPRSAIARLLTVQPEDRNEG